MSSLGRVWIKLSFLSEEEAAAGAGCLISCLFLLLAGVMQLLLPYLQACFLTNNPGSVGRRRESTKRANGISSNCFGSKKVLHFMVLGGRGAVFKCDYPNNRITDSHTNQWIFNLPAKK